MSIFQATRLDCPQCGTAVDFRAVHSVNVDRRPDLRTAILRGEFQRETCPSCGTGFRLDAAFLYLDLGRRQWVAAQPVPGLAEWPERETRARALFDDTYGEHASAIAREISQGVQPRLVFGWSALREKLIAAEAGLDDHALELLKLAMMRNLPSSPFARGTTLRLMDSVAERLLMGWVRNADDAVADLRWVPRELYDDIVADAGLGDKSLWGELRAQFAGALFVDVDRLLVPPR